MEIVQLASYSYGKESDLISPFRHNLQIILCMKNFPANIFYKEIENIKMDRVKEVYSQQPETPEQFPYSDLTFPKQALEIYGIYDINLQY